MKSSICKLYAEDGTAIGEPVAFVGEVSWRLTDGQAQAFSPDGKLLAEMHNAKVEWIEAAGIRISGMEALDSSNTKFRVQAWHYRPG